MTLQDGRLPQQASDEEVSPRVRGFERIFVSATALVCGAFLVLYAVLGPLVLGVLQYRTSQSGEWQLMGNDLVNLVLVAPICVLGGILHLRESKAAKYFLILPSIYLLYTGLTVGIGMEWSHPAYTGNSEQFFWIFMTLAIGGLILLVFGLQMFSPADAPSFNPKRVKIYAGLMALFLIIFAFMWLSEIGTVVTMGDTETGSYSAAPNVFWVIKYFDLTLSIPLGLIGMYMLVTRPKAAFPVLMLFFGFFTTMVTAVNAIAWMMFLNNDPELQSFALVLFGVMALFIWGGFLFLVKDKLHRGKTA